MAGCLAVLAAISGCTALNPSNDRAFEVSVAWIAERPAVAWYGGRLAHEAIFLRFADDRGRPLGPALQLTDAARNAFEPSLQELHGDVLVAWYEQDSAKPGIIAKQAAMLARFDTAGRRLWQRQLSAADASGRIPVVRVGKGIIHAAWLEQRADSAPLLRVASLDAQGDWLQSPRDALLVGSTTWNLNAALGGDGSFHVLVDSNYANRASELHWVRAGPQNLSDSQITPDDGAASVFPDIAIQGSRAAIAWFDDRDGNPEVYLRCVHLEAQAPPADLQRDVSITRVTRTPAESVGAYLTWDQDDIQLVWTEVRGKRRELWQQRFDQNCRPRSAARREPGWGRQAGIAALASSANGLALAWNGLRGTTSVTRLKVRPRVISPSATAR